MRHPRFLLLGLAVWPVSSCLLVPPLHAQNVVFTESGGKLQIVRGASGARPVIVLDGKRIAIEGYRLGLKPVETFLPVFISVRNVDVQTSYGVVEDTASPINNELHFRARFESPYALDNVFVLLDLRGERAGRMFFLYEIGRLEPRDPKQVSILVPMSFPLGAGMYSYHVFVDGVETLHSGIPYEQRETALDRMVAKRVASAKDGAPQLFVGPEPEYPDSLRKAGVKGQAIIAVRITAAGRVIDPAVKEATDPAFGEAALDAVRLWRFLPRVKNGRPVDSSAEIPFEFTPPKGGK